MKAGDARNRVFWAVAVLLGTLSIALLLRDVRIDGLQVLLHRVGIGVLLVPLPQLIGLALETWGWQKTIGIAWRPVAFRTLFSIRLSTESIGQLAPGGPVLAESMKPSLLLRHAGMPLALGVGATLQRKYVRLVAHGLYVLGAGVLGWSALQAVPSGLVGPALGWLLLGFGLALLLAAQGMFMAFGKGRLATRTYATLRKFPLASLRRWVYGARHQFGAVDRDVRRFFALEPRQMALPVAFCLAAWFTEALESWLILRLLGADVPFLLLLGLDVAVSLCRQIAFFVPAGVGVQEAGYLLVLSTLGLGDPITLTGAFALLKRCKEGTLALAAFALWSRMERFDHALLQSEGVGSTPVALGTSMT